MKKKEFLSIVLLGLLSVGLTNAQQKIMHGKVLAFNKFPVEKAQISI